MLSEKDYIDCCVMNREKLISLASKFVPFSEAEDIVQIAMLKAYTVRDKFRGDSTPYTWLYRIVINTALNERKKKSGVPKYYIDIDDEDEYFPNDIGRLVDLEDPMYLISVEKLVESINKVIKDMPPKYKYTYDLWADGMTYRKISELRGVPIGTVRSCIHRAKTYIRTKLGMEDLSIYADK